MFSKICFKTSVKKVVSCVPLSKKKHEKRKKLPREFGNLREKKTLNSCMNGI